MGGDEGDGVARVGKGRVDCLAEGGVVRGWDEVRVGAGVEGAGFACVFENGGGEAGVGFLFFGRRAIFGFGGRWRAWGWGFLLGNDREAFNEGLVGGFWVCEGVVVLGFIC